jgi:hypothetical protein
MENSTHTPFRILVIANDAVDGADLQTTLRRHAGDGRPTEALVVAPALSTRLRFWASDVDSARRRAEARLRHSLAGLAGDGVTVEATIGDSDPLQAIVDGLCVFAADEIVLVTHPKEEEIWAEHNLADRARELFPEHTIVHLVVGPRRLLGVEHAFAAA